jgi:small subunit ribosomal protein S2
MWVGIFDFTRILPPVSWLDSCLRRNDRRTGSVSDKTLGKDYFFIFSIMAIATLVKSMLENAVHIGHKREYWSPKMRDYIYGVQNGVHVFDLYKTAAKLEEAKAVLEDLSSKGKSILFVGTKIQSKDLVEALATSTGQYYVNSKWVPGLLTNFTTIKKRIAYYNELEASLANGMLEGMTKKEKSVKMKELEKLKASYQGVKDMKRTPDLLVVVDGHYEDLALAEAAVLGTTTIALLGSTGDIDKTTYFVPCNVNSIKALAFMLGELKTSIKAKKSEDKKPMGRTDTFAPKTPIAKAEKSESAE